MGVEEQQEERQVLASIFPEEITDISDTEFRIAIKLEQVTQDGSDNAEPPTLMLSVRFPESYPDTAPHLDILPCAASTYLNVTTDRARLLRSLDDAIAENLGMAMIFTLVMQLKDTAESLIDQRRNTAQDAEEQKRRREEERENEKFNGTVVTRKRFLAWRDRFREEIEREQERKAELDKAEDKKKASAKPKEGQEEKLTGRQLWERGLMGKLDDLDNLSTYEAVIAMDNIRSSTTAEVP